MARGEAVPVALALGGDLGDPEGTFDLAAAALREGGVGDIVRAPAVRSAPVDCVPGTPDFTNSALTGTWRGTPEELLDLTQAIEVRLGRPAAHDRHAARAIDIDLLLFGDRIIRTARLTVPHPRMTRRRFVLAPLAEIAGERAIPGAGLTVRQALERLPAEEGRLRFPGPARGSSPTGKESR